MAPGPVLIFDKSALQALSVDESTWLDQFFLTNITPIFFVETLADLEKVDSRGRKGEAVVAEIAEKVPVLNPHPCTFHETLIAQDLLGIAVPLTWRIPLSGGIPKSDGQGGVTIQFGEPPEIDTLRRWTARAFYDVERLHARNWRAALSGIDFDARIRMVRNLLPPRRRISSLEDARAFAEEFVGTGGREVIAFAQQMLRVPSELIGEIDRRYESLGRPRLSSYAPYAAFVLSVDVTVYLGMSIDQISAQRPNNIVDVAYLYYLPFCMVFVSGDKLHRRLAPLFMRPDQHLVWAPKMKHALQTLDRYYERNSDRIEQEGVLTFAREPPDDEMPTLVSVLWRRCLPRRTRGAATGSREKELGESDRDLIDRIEGISRSPETLAHDVLRSEPDSVLLQHTVPFRRGRWRLISREIEDRMARGSGSDKKGTG